MIIENILKVLTKLKLEEDCDQWHPYNNIVWAKHRLTLDQYWKMKYEHD